MEEGGVWEREINEEEEEYKLLEEAVWRSAEVGGAREWEESGDGGGRIEEDMDEEGRRVGRAFDTVAFRIVDWRRSSISYFLYSGVNFEEGTLGKRTF